MRILKVTQAYYPYLEKGGLAVKVRAVAEHLARRGHAVTVLTAHYGHPLRKAVRTVGNVEVIYLRYVARYRPLTVNPGVLAFSRRLREFDLVHIYGLYDLLGPVVAWFCRLWDIPYVVEPMGMYRSIIRSFLKKQLYHRILGRSLVEGAAYLIATSEQERQELLAEGLTPAKVIVRRNGLELQEFEALPPQGVFRKELGLSEDERLVLYVGRLSHKKGLDLLLQAFAGLKISARLVIVGPDERDGCVEELERLRVELRLRDRVMLTGPRFGIEKLAAMVDADLFVLPSRNENFGNTVAEALACGVPVIVTDQCGIAPLVQDRVGLVVPFVEPEGRWRGRGIRGKGNQENVEALREALTKLLTDRELQARFRVNTARVAQELSWEEPITEQERIYQEMLRKSRDIGEKLESTRSS